LPREQREALDRALALDLDHAGRPVVALATRHRARDAHRPRDRQRALLVELDAPELRAGALLELRLLHVATAHGAHEAAARANLHAVRRDPEAVVEPARDLARRARLVRQLTGAEPRRASLVLAQQLEIP